jgi:hypothetical protein
MDINLSVRSVVFDELRAFPANLQFDREGSAGTIRPNA